jgi:hypothetical protein
VIRRSIFRWKTVCNLRVMRVIQLWDESASLTGSFVTFASRKSCRPLELAGLDLSFIVSPLRTLDPRGRSPSPFYRFTYLFTAQRHVDKNATSAMRECVASAEARRTSRFQ